MRTLLLLRHAKSTWDDPTLDDHERPLNKRGAKEAPRIGAWIAERQLRPDIVLCSDAVRTRATLSLVLAAMGGQAPAVRFEPRLYLAQPPGVLEALGRVEPAAERCLVVGHNPGLHALALGLVGDGNAKDIARLAMGFPTAALAVLELPAHTWKSLEPGSGRLAALVTGKEL